MGKQGMGSGVSAWWPEIAPVDFRCGADRLLVHVREVLAWEPLVGSAYVFFNRLATRLKVLVVDAQGVWLSVRRLHQGPFVWPSAGEALWAPGRAQFAWLCAGVDWQRLSAPMPLEQRV